MAKITEWSKEQKKAWRDWVSTRPPIIQDLCKRFPPYNLYRLKSSGHRVTIYAYSEDETITVNVSGKYNAIIFERRVFGIRPDGLEECDLPKSDDMLGTVLTEKEDVEEFINYVRPSVKNG